MSVKSFFISHRRKVLLLLGILLLWYWFSLPSPLFRDPTSFVLEAKDGSLLGARIAADGQWRFPASGHVPEKFAAAIITFEDKRFYRHPGIDLLAFGRAVMQNIKTGGIVSGGSTLTMQVMRLSGKGEPRTVLRKILEMVRATRLEISCSKEEILGLYSSHAPFGGNVVGLDAAAWRYFGKAPHQLSWGEAATLAVLPNSPSLIHPGRNRQALLEKRNRLLNKLLQTGTIDKTTCELALEEPLSGPPKSLPAHAPHLLERASQNHDRTRATRLRSTIDLPLQLEANRIAEQRNLMLKNNEVHNLAVIILDVESNEVVAYVGNAGGTGAQHAENVDIITAPRSTGSIMKPFLYARALQEGTILPESLLPDIPTYLQNYRPQNYLETYDGMISAKRALSRSLNIPFVRLLQQYGTEKFHYDLKKLGITTLNRPPQHYGLTLILGGAEATLWDLTNVYAGMARTLNHFYPNQGRYRSDDYEKATYIKEQNSPLTDEGRLNKESSLLSADAIWFTFEAMKTLERPNMEGEWERFSSARQVAWKTGTSFGFRDAWAIGVTPDYVVGVWVGNADGEGRPGLIGFQAAAPLLFGVFDLLPESSRWFDPPYDAMRQMEVCSKSGFPALGICEKDTMWMPENAISVSACTFHKVIHVDESAAYQVNSDCETMDKIRSVPWFILPPVEAQYYKPRNPAYRPPPPLRPDCPLASVQADSPMQLIYPENKTRIYIPLDLDGRPGRAVFKAAHKQEGATLHWHIDNEYIGSTTNFHNLELNPTPGHHRLTIVDDHGARLERQFEILTKEEGKAE